jgi:hypothetical protein
VITRFGIVIADFAIVITRFARRDQVRAARRVRAQRRPVHEPSATLAGAAIAVEISEERSEEEATVDEAPPAPKP